jgi:hypothetical protein
VFDHAGVASSSLAPHRLSSFSDYSFSSVL